MSESKKIKKETKTESEKGELDHKVMSNQSIISIETPVAPDSVLSEGHSTVDPKPASVQGQQTEEVHETEEVVELLAFRLANEEYAVNLLYVKEIIRLVPITPIPRAPSHIKGVMTLRGVIIPIFDLCARLRLNVLPTNRKTRMIIVTLKKGVIGFIVDEVSEVIRLKVSEIKPPHPMLDEQGSEHLKGIGRTGDRMLILLDIERAITVC